MIKLLCFDLDGTLIDSAGDITTAINRTLAERGRAELTRAVVTSHIGEGLRPLLKGIFPEIVDPDAQEALVDRFLSVYEEEMTGTTTLFPGVVEMIEEWLNRGGKIGLITNKNEAPTRRLFSHFGFDRYPWVGVFGADTWPERKPSPLPLRMMMELAGTTPDETLMIGDGVPDMRSATAAGVRAVALEFGYTDIEILKEYAPALVLANYSGFARRAAAL